MLTDQLAIFTDHKEVRASAASDVVEVAPFTGKGSDTVYVSVSVEEAYASGVTLSIAVQESADKTAWTTLETVSVPADTVTHGGYCYFALPHSLKKKFVRLNYSVTGISTTGKLFSGITIEALDTYEKGMYINHGKVEG